MKQLTSLQSLLKERDLRLIDLARLIAVDKATITRWSQSNRIPAERMFDVERATGIPWQKLRPDLLPALEHVA